MSFIADLHIHSKYSRACSKDCDLENLTWWARRKGITLVGTGDFTHPAWYAHLNEVLVPAELGLYRLNNQLQDTVDSRTPQNCRTPVRFMLCVEISTIYKRDDRTRKVHHLVYFPDLDAVARFNKALGAIGNLGSDGRPILGLDSRDLLEITLDASPDGYLIPAHIWTPWFAALGSKSGFDAIADCYADLAPHIFAVETGLSSDPEMNWRVSSLDKYTLVSNSDAHSPPMLGREATELNCALDYFAIRDTLQANDGTVRTIEFFPDEGKYHLDGHRACGVRWEPAETKAHKLRCSHCGKPVTVGVAHRIDDLADRSLGERRAGASQFRNLIQLPQVVGEIYGKGPKTKTVLGAVDSLVARLGPELQILTTVPITEISQADGPELAEAITRLRAGQVIRHGGYDGEYGVIKLFEDTELAELRSGAALFQLPTSSKLPEKPAPAVKATAQVDQSTKEPEEANTGLDPEQQAAVVAPIGPLLIVAGPGTGKTRTLINRIVHVITNHQVPAENILALTFTRRAAGEMTERLVALLTGPLPLTCTFHALALHIVRDNHVQLGLAENFRIVDDPEEGAITVDDLLPTAVTVINQNPDLAERYQQRWPHIFVDEYQDIDELQYQLLQLLTTEQPSLCVIGDPDQAIYSFRGADVRFFSEFTDNYPNATVVRLHRNYRSSKSIVEAAVQLMADQPVQSAAPPRQLTAIKSGTEPISWYGATSDYDEAEQVARNIDNLLGGTSFHSFDTKTVDSRASSHGEFALRDIAVLYRTSAQAAPLMQALTKAGIPFQHRSHDPFNHRPGVSNLLAELRLTEDTVDLSDRLRNAAQRLESRLDNPLSQEDKTQLRPADVWSAAEVLAPLARECGTDSEEFFAKIAAGVQTDSFDPRADAIGLLTLHAAKGLEFDAVFIVGCSDGTLPLRFASGNDEDLAEERRLFFVGLTRARRLLFLSGVTEGSQASWRNRRSPFVASLADRLVIMARLAAHRSSSSDKQLKLL